MAEENLDKWWKVKEAGQRLDITEKTVLRWIKLGKLRAQRSGKCWLIEPVKIGEGKTEEISEDVRTLREIIELLKRELEDSKRELGEKNKQISELHILLGRKALPQGEESRHWWRFWGR